MRLKDFDFRIYDRKNKQYITEDKLESVGLGVVKCANTCAFLYFLDDKSIDYYTDVDIELWTGLYDKYNRKIFEGDIVSHLVDGGGVEYLSRVEFNQQKGMFEFICIEHPCVSDFSSLANKTIKVIGNIYENPELLGD